MGFNHAWKITFADKTLVSRAPTWAVCRDSAFYTAQREMFDTFWRSVDKQVPNLREDLQSSAFVHWCRRHVADVQIEACTYADTSNANIVLPEQLPRVIAILQSVFPTVRVEQCFTDVPTKFGRAELRTGLKLTGDMHTVAAWYWATYFIRCILYEPGEEWQTPEALFLRDDDEGDHIDLWLLMTDGKEHDWKSSPWVTLGLGIGPVETWLCLTGNENWLETYNQHVAQKQSLLNVEMI